MATIALYMHLGRANVILRGFDSSPSLSPQCQAPTPMDTKRGPTAIRRPYEPWEGPWSASRGGSTPSRELRVLSASWDTDKNRPHLIQCGQRPLDCHQSTAMPPPMTNNTLPVTWMYRPSYMGGTPLTRRALSWRWLGLWLNGIVSHVVQHGGRP